MRSIVKTADSMRDRSRIAETEAFLQATSFTLTDVRQNLVLRLVAVAIPNEQTLEPLPSHKKSLGKLVPRLLVSSIIRVQITE